MYNTIDYKHQYKKYKYKYLQAGGADSTAHSNAETTTTRDTVPNPTISMILTKLATTKLTIYDATVNGVYKLIKIDKVLDKLVFRHLLV